MIALFVNPLKVFIFAALLRFTFRFKLFLLHTCKHPAKYYICSPFKKEGQCRKKFFAG